MGFIREPDGVDLIIAPAEYTNADRAEVSTFFRKHKALKTGKVVEVMNIKRKVFA